MAERSPAVYVVVVVVVVVEFNAIFQHTIGYTWQPVLLVEEEPQKTPGKNNQPMRSYWQAF